MNISLLRWVAVLALGAVGGVRVSAQMVVNVDFDYVGNGSQTYSGQGVYDDPGHNFWNAINYAHVSGTTLSASGLKASDGVTVTGITFSLTNFEDLSDSQVSLSGGGSDGPVASDLMRDYLYMFGDSANVAAFSIGGLTPGGTYDIYIYSAVGGLNWTRDRQAVFTLDGVSQGVTGFSAATDGGTLYTDFVEGDNYLKFTVTTAGTSIAGSFYTPTPNGEAEFNGFQIVAVPEPATYATASGLLALGAVWAVRRRQRAR